jgi:hypothetical protein
VTGIIALLSYLYWTPVGSTFIDGIGGRYFIPLAPAVLLLLSCLAVRLPETRALQALRPRLNQIAAAAALCVCVYFVVLVWGRYYGWVRGESPLFATPMQAAVRSDCRLHRLSGCGVGWARQRWQMAYFSDSLTQCQA